MCANNTSNHSRRRRVPIPKLRYLSIPSDCIKVPKKTPTSSSSTISYPSRAAQPCLSPQVPSLPRTLGPEDLGPVVIQDPGINKCTNGQADDDIATSSGREIAPSPSRNGSGSNDVGLEKRRRRGEGGPVDGLGRWGGDARDECGRHHVSCSNEIYRM